MSWAPSQQVHEQLDQIMHNLQQDRDHHSAENTLRLLWCQWPRVIITMAPAGHIRFCGAWCLYRWERELVKKKNTALVRHRDLVETHASSGGPETEVSLTLGYICLRTEVVLSAMRLPTNCFILPAFPKSPVARLH